MTPRSKESTRPRFPKLLAQQTKSFQSASSPAAFPSLSLVRNQVTVSNDTFQSQTDSSQSCNAYTDSIDQENEKVNTQVSPSCATPDATVIDSPDSVELNTSPTHINWASLELSSQHFIFDELLRQQPDAYLIAIALGLNHTELEDIERAINIRNIYPASVDEIWNYCVAMDNIGPAAMAPNTLDRYLGYLVLAGTYEEVTPEGLNTTRGFLRQHGLDVIMSNAFMNRFDESLTQEPYPLALQYRQNVQNTNLPVQKQQMSGVAGTAYPDLPDSAGRRLPSRSHETFERLGRHTANPGQSRSVPDRRLANHSSEPYTPIQIRTRVETALQPLKISQGSPSILTGGRAKGIHEAKDSIDGIASAQSFIPLRVDEPSKSLSPVSLEIDHDTGRASVVGLSRKRYPLKFSLAQGFPHHTLHQPFAFAPHFICHGFPSDIRRRLLATDPRMLNATNFWLIYGNGEAQHHSIDLTGLARTKRDEYNPRTTILEYPDFESQSLHTLVQIHNEWVRAGIWKTARQQPGLLSHFERISVMTLENLKPTESNDVEVQHSSGHADLVLGPVWNKSDSAQAWNKSPDAMPGQHSHNVSISPLEDCRGDASGASFREDENTIVRQFPPQEIDADQEGPAQKDSDFVHGRYSPERPSFSPISEFGGSVPDWLIDEEA